VAFALSLNAIFILSRYFFPGLFMLGSMNSPFVASFHVFIKPLIVAGVVYIYLRKLTNIPDSIDVPSRAANIIFFTSLLILIVVPLFPAIKQLIKQPSLSGSGYAFVSWYSLIFQFLPLLFAGLYWKRTGKLAPAPAEGAWNGLRVFGLWVAAIAAGLYLVFYFAPLLITLFYEIPRDATFLFTFTRGVGLLWLSWLLWVPIAIMEIARWFPRQTALVPQAVEDGIYY